MTSPRRGNADALIAARRRDSQEKHNRVRATIATLTDEGQPISFRAVAVAAGVSEGLVHHPDLKPLILAAKAEQDRVGLPAQPAQTRSATKITAASTAADAELLREHNARLRADLARMTERLRARLGEESDPELRLAAQRLAAAEDRGRELALENSTLRAESTRLALELERATEELASLRVAHSRLMKRINTRPSTPTEGGSS